MSSLEWAEDGACASKRGTHQGDRRGLPLPILGISRTMLDSNAALGAPHPQCLSLLCKEALGSIAQPDMVRINLLPRPLPSVAPADQCRAYRGHSSCQADMREHTLLHGKWKDTKLLMGALHPHPRDLCPWDCSQHTGEAGWMCRGGVGSGGLWAELPVGCELSGFAGHWIHPPPFLPLPVASSIGTGLEPREK